MMHDRSQLTDDKEGMNHLFDGCVASVVVLLVLW